MPVSVSLFRFAVNFTFSEQAAVKARSRTYRRDSNPPERRTQAVRGRASTADSAHTGLCWAAAGLTAGFGVLPAPQTRKPRSHTPSDALGYHLSPPRRPVVGGSCRWNDAQFSSPSG